MGTGIRKKREEVEIQKREETVQSSCLFCDGEIYTTNDKYCNSFCLNADLYGSKQAIVMWSAATYTI